MALASEVMRGMSQFSPHWRRGFPVSEARPVAPGVPRFSNTYCFTVATLDRFLSGVCAAAVSDADQVFADEKEPFL